MLLYESAKVLHGRQKPLEGESYDNLFVHFKPEYEWYEKEFDMKDLPMGDAILTKDDLIE